MPWVILTKKLPVKPSPPKLSIHWAEEWKNKEILEAQKQRYAAFNDAGEDVVYSHTKNKYIGEIELPDGGYFVDYFGKEQTWICPMKIHYKGSDIRVLDDEYNILTTDKMRGYVFGLEDEGIPSHELVPDTDKKDALLYRTVLDTDLRSLFDAAMLDGCNGEMAYQLALGQDFSDEEFEFPPIGWYRCKPEFAEYYCYEDEMTED